MIIIESSVYFKIFFSIFVDNVGITFYNIEKSYYSHIVMEGRFE